MINNNLISELPFTPRTNQLILNCIVYDDYLTLYIKSKIVFQKLCHRGDSDEIPYLKCGKCKNCFTSTEDLLEGFKYMSN